MLSMIIAAAALGAAASASATPAVYMTGDSAHVRYGDLNLQSGSGRQRLAVRIHHAAELLCDAPHPARLLAQPQAQCFRMALADGVAQMNVISHR